MEASWAPLGASWGVFGASWGHLGRVLGASWGVLGASCRVLGFLEASWAVLEASWVPKPPNINLTRHGTGSAAFLKGSLLQKPCGTTLDRKASSRSPPLRSLRWPYDVSLGFAGGSLIAFCCDFAGVSLRLAVLKINPITLFNKAQRVKFKDRKSIPKSMPKPSQSRCQNIPKSMPKPPKIVPKTLQNRGLEGVR